MNSIIDRINNIDRIEATELKSGYFRIDAVMANGKRETLKKKSTNIPTRIQAHSLSVNGNFRGDGIGGFFTYTKAPNPDFAYCHLKSFKISRG